MSQGATGYFSSEALEDFGTFPLTSKAFSKNGCPTEDEGGQREGKEGFGS